MNNFPLDTVYLDSVDSTNSYLKRIIKESGLSKGMAVFTKHQSAGRGRLGRMWLSSESTLCMSIAIKNAYCEGFTLLAALAVFEALKGFCPDKSLKIKWPNDIICDGKKLCGILCERIDEYTVIGIGINVNDERFESEIKHKATSLYLLSGSRFDTKDVFKAVNSSFEAELERFGYEFTEKAKKVYLSLCENIGREVQTADISGTAVDINSNGSLIVDSEGALKNVTSGEVAVHGIY